jgi:hypothetical protein
MNNFLFILTIVFCSFAGWNERVPNSINSNAAPRDVDPHHNSGGKRIVRINNTIISICPDAGEKTYRSNDNGESWSLIDASRGRGCMISGADSTVFHFFRTHTEIYMVKFKYNTTPGAPVIICTFPKASKVMGSYKMLTATVNSKGHLFVVSHWESPDRIFIITSRDNGKSWSEPHPVSPPISFPCCYPHLEANTNDVLFCTFHKFVTGKMYFTKSEDDGKNWSSQIISTSNIMNASILPIGTKTIFVFAQGDASPLKGLLEKHSYDGGDSWSRWKLIESTCGYADPSSALGIDQKSIFVAFRSSKNTGVSSGSCGDRSRSKLVCSRDCGKTWSAVDSHYVAERTGTRNQIRYQTWWNYGGPLEWIWMQYENKTRRIYYDINIDEKIFQQK